MKKLFKRITLVLLTVCAAFACAFAVSACGDDKDKGDNSSPKYVFAVLNEDETAFTKTIDSLQICVDATGSCYPLDDYSLDSHGKLTLSQQQINSICHSSTNITKFSFHVIGAEGYAYDCAFEVDGAKTYSCKLTK